MNGEGRLGCPGKENELGVQRFSEPPSQRDVPRTSYVPGPGKALEPRALLTERGAVPKPQPGERGLLPPVYLDSPATLYAPGPGVLFGFLLLRCSGTTNLRDARRSLLGAGRPARGVRGGSARTLLAELERSPGIVCAQRHGRLGPHQPSLARAPRAAVLPYRPPIARRRPSVLPSKEAPRNTGAWEASSSVTRRQRRCHRGTRFAVSLRSTGECMP